MDGIAKIVEAEYDRLTNEIRKSINVYYQNDSENQNDNITVEEYQKAVRSLRKERGDVERWFATLADAGDTANVLPRDFLAALDISTQLL